MASCIGGFGEWRTFSEHHDRGSKVLEDPGWQAGQFSPVRGSIGFDHLDVGVVQRSLEFFGPDLTAARLRLRTTHSSPRCKNTEPLPIRHDDRLRPCGDTKSFLRSNAVARRGYSNRRERLALAMFRSRTRRGRQDGGVCDHGKPSAVAIPQNSDVSHLVRIDDDVAATVQPCLFIHISEPTRPY